MPGSGDGFRSSRLSGTGRAAFVAAHPLENGTAQRQSARTMAARGRMALAFPMSRAIWVPQSLSSRFDKETFGPIAGAVTLRYESVARF